MHSMGMTVVLHGSDTRRSNTCVLASSGQVTGNRSVQTKGIQASNSMWRITAAAITMKGSPATYIVTEVMFSSYNRVWFFYYRQRVRTEHEFTPSPKEIFPRCINANSADL